MKGTMEQVLLALFINSLFLGKFHYVPGIGRALDFLHSQAVPILIAIVIVLLVIFLYLKYFTGRLKRSYREFASPIIEESQRSNLALAEKIEHTEKALDSFASAMQEYAKHMASHTQAIVGLSEASQALRTSAIEQNRILFRLSNTLEKEKSVREVSRVERAVSELEKRTALVLQVKDELENKAPQIKMTPQRETPIKVEIKSPPGCLVKSGALYTRGHFNTN